MPPVSRQQQKLVFAKAEEGVPWAKRWVAEGKMHIQKKKRKRRLRKRAKGHRR